MTLFSPLSPPILHSSSCLNIKFFLARKVDPFLNDPTVCDAIWCLLLCLLFNSLPSLLLVLQPLNLLDALPLLSFLLEPPSHATQLQTSAPLPISMPLLWILLQPFFFQIMLPSIPAFLSGPYSDHCLQGGFSQWLCILDILFH